MNPKQTANDLLKQLGAKLKRSKKHEVWELPNGNTFVRAATPSDVKAADNSLANLKKTAGIVDSDRGQPGERRDRHEKPGRMDTTGKIKFMSESRQNTTMAEKLAASGAIEQTLRAELERERAKNRPATYDDQFDAGAILPGPIVERTPPAVGAHAIRLAVVFFIFTFGDVLAVALGAWLSVTYGLVNVLLMLFTVLFCLLLAAILTVIFTDFGKWLP